MKIIIFGLGDNGKIFKEYVEKNEKDNEIIAFLDNSCDLNYKYYDEIIPIYKPEEISSLLYDKIVITNRDKSNICNIKRQLAELNVPAEKVISLYECEELKLKVFASYNRFGEENARVRWLKNYSVFVKEEDIKGNVAECGVYNGDFAEYINKYFSDRKLYLFDTFTGFDKRDLDIERNINDEAFLKGIYNQDGFFNDAKEDVVLYRMEHKENCIIKKGFFPDTAKELDDKFCFVNLDMDLYKPILEGLRFFYDKMNLGGVILVHDYYLDELPGARLAVKAFEQEYGKKLFKIPIGDFCSIAIIKYFDNE